MIFDLIFTEKCFGDLSQVFLWQYWGDKEGNKKEEGRKIEEGKVGRRRKEKEKKNEDHKLGKKWLFYARPSEKSFCLGGGDQISTITYWLRRGWGIGGLDLQNLDYVIFGCSLTFVLCASKCNHCSAVHPLKAYHPGLRLVQSSPASCLCALV